MKAENLTKTPESKEELAVPTSNVPMEAPGSTMFRKLLVPIDFSRNSRVALSYACSLAEAGKTEIHLLFVAEAIPQFSGFAQLPIVLSDDQLTARCSEELAILAEDLAQGGTPISREVRIGRPAHEIARCALEYEADLIVLSTHGHTGLKHVLLGSVAEEVVREAACPVLVVRRATTVAPGEANPPRFQKILVPTDFSPRSGEAIEYAVQFAKRFGGKITLLHCINPASAASTKAYAAYDLELLSTACAAEANREMASQRHGVPEGLFEHSSVLSGAPLSVIPKFAEEENFDLIICATRGRTGLRHTLLGSTADGIVRHSPCPVLVYGEKTSRRIDRKTSLAYESVRGEMLLGR